MLTGSTELCDELDRRQDELAEMTRYIIYIYMAQVDYVFSQNPAPVAAYRPRDPWGRTSYNSGCMPAVHLAHDLLEGDSKALPSDVATWRRPEGP